MKGDAIDTSVASKDLNSISKRPAEGRAVANVRLRGDPDHELDNSITAGAVYKTTWAALAGLCRHPVIVIFSR